MNVYELVDALGGFIAIGRAYVMYEGERTLVGHTDGVGMVLNEKGAELARSLLATPAAAEKAPKAPKAPKALKVKPAAPTPEPALDVAPVADDDLAFE